MAYATLDQIITALDKLVTTGKIGNLDNISKMVLKHPPTNATKIVMTVTNLLNGQKEIFMDGGA